MARKRVVSPLKIQNWTEADALMRKMAAHQREVDITQAAMQEAIDNTKASAETDCKEHLAAIKEGEKQLCLFAQLHKDEFDKSRSRTLNFGTIGYRKSTTLKLLYPITEIIRLLKVHGMTDCIRQRAEDVDKNKLRQQPEDAIQTVGGKLETKDTFYVELDQAQLEATEGMVTDGS